MEDRKALEEVLENYAHVCREDRRKMEEARVERVRRDLGLVAVEVEPAVEEVRGRGEAARETLNILMMAYKLHIAQALILDIKCMRCVLYM